MVPPRQAELSQHAGVCRVCTNFLETLRKVHAARNVRSAQGKYSFSFLWHGDVEIANGLSIETKDMLERNT